MACGQQVLHASCCLTHWSAPGRLQSGAFPISKVRQAGSLIHSTRKKAFRHNFFSRFTAACVARGRRPGARQGRSVLRTTSARRPIPRVEEKVRRDGSQRGQEVKRKTRGLSVWWPTKRCRFTFSKRSTQKSGEARLQDDGL